MSTQTSGIGESVAAKEGPALEPLFPNAVRDISSIGIATPETALSQDNPAIRSEAEIALDALHQQCQEDLHDLKNPLTAVKILSQLIGKTMRNDSLTANERLEKVQALQLQLDHKISVLELSVGNVFAFYQPLRPERLEVGAILNEQIENVRLANSARQFMVNGNPAAELTTDRVVLTRIVGNLLGNANKYSGGALPIHISVSEDGGFVVISVRDFGPGISSEELPYIFDSGYRSKSTSTAVDGFGIGLHSVRQHVERLGGAIDVESQLGEGTKFTVRLPGGWPAGT